MTEYHTNNIQSSVKLAISSELAKPRLAYLFDVDGVITDAEAKKVTQPEILDEIIKRLEDGEPVGFNTGRSLDFMEEVLNQLEDRVRNKTLLRNVYAIGEKGSTWITYNEQGYRINHVDQEFNVPVEIQQQVRSLVTQPPFEETMFYDETKRTMVTAELKHGRTLLEFQEPQRQFVEKLREILAQHPRGYEFRVDPTRIATDVESRSAGKALGARRFIELLKESGAAPQGYISFGDSASDYDMHEELKKLGKKAEFVFVGGREHLEGKNLEGVTFTEDRFDTGTLKYLQAHSAAK